MQTHRRLMLLGGILLILTFLIDSYHRQGAGDGFNYAYATGIAMIAVFLASFGLFYSGGRGK